MKKLYEVLLTKSYKIQIKAESNEVALRMSELFTSDIIDISTEKEKLDNYFQIEEIKCLENNAFECNEL
jgi:hypothetical protein